MVEAKKKLYSEIQSAIKADDYDIVIGILVEQVGWLLKNNKKGLIQAVREAGGNAADNISDADLAKMVSNALLNKHKPFIEKLLTLIFEDGYSNDAASTVSSLVSAGGTVAGAIENPADVSAQGITAIGDAIINLQFGKATAKAQKDLDAETKRAKAYELASQIIAKKDEAKLGTTLSAEDTQIEAAKQKNYMQIGFIVGGTLILSLIIWAAYKASK